MDDIFQAVWGNKVVTGEEKPVKPNMIAFKNSEHALDMLYKHIRNRSNIAIHCDVDVDGIGSGYIAGKFISYMTGKDPLYIINKDKEHGIQQKHADFFRDKPLDLLIIVDSSSNELEVIKQFKCDVLVVDHHEVSHNQLCGDTDGENCKYIIVNNTIDNNDIDAIKIWMNNFKECASENLTYYEADDRMSCGLVIYELLRLYCEAVGPKSLLENLKLFQWVGVTLFTDAILLNTPRNQWYIENTVHSLETESTLNNILKELNSFKLYLDKSTINYTFAPIINKAIRAGHSGDALKAVIHNNSFITDLLKYRDTQDQAIQIGVSDFKSTNSYILRDMSKTNVHKNYNGVIASRLCGDNNKNCVVYRVSQGIAEGSFRGRYQGIDYRKLISEYNDYSEAQGHKTAFGFRCRECDIDDIMNKLVSIESFVSDQPLLTAGKINETSPGKFVIDNIEEFKKQGGLWKLGIGNSKLSTDEQILITVSSSDAVLFEQKGKLYIYSILGMKCKAFEPIKTPVIHIYVEYSRQIDCYIK